MSGTIEAFCAAASSVDPRDGYLRNRYSEPVCDRSQLLYQREVGIEIGALEARRLRPEVTAIVAVLGPMPADQPRDNTP